MTVYLDDRYVDVCDIMASLAGLGLYLRATSDTFIANELHGFSGIVVDNTCAPGKVELITPEGDKIGHVNILA